MTRFVGGVWGAPAAMPFAAILVVACSGSAARGPSVTNVVDVAAPKPQSSSDRPKPSSAKQSSGDASASEPGELALFAGVYRGRLMSGDQMVPVVTRLQLRDGRLGGGYNFGPDLAEGGTLHDCKLRESNVVGCLWRDNYGRGTLLMRFFDKAARFEGQWAPDHDEYDQYPWDGSRAE